MEEWKGKFFTSDTEEPPVDFEPDHVVTVSEVTGNLPRVTETVEDTAGNALMLQEKEAEDYRQLLAEIRRPYQPPREKQLSGGVKALLTILAITVSAGAGLLFAYGVFALRGRIFRFPAFLPAAGSMALFLLCTFFYFCTKGKTEKLLIFLLLISGAAAFLSVF